jgi:hypothetical protein
MLGRDEVADWVGLEVGSGVEVGDGVFEVLALSEPLLVRAAPPFREVLLVDMGGGRAKVLEDDAVGYAVGEELVEAGTDGFGELSDFAGGTAGEGRGVGA